MKTESIPVPPGAVINLAGNKVRDLIEALQQIDPDTQHTVVSLRVYATGKLGTFVSGPNRLAIRFDQISHD